VRYDDENCYRLQENVLMKNYNTIRAPGIADALHIVYDAMSWNTFTKIVWDWIIPS
jgi:hypothetical protein